MVTNQEEQLWILTCWIPFKRLIFCHIPLVNTQTHTHTHTHTHIYMYISKPYIWAWCNTMSIFKKSLTCLDSVFSFSLRSYHNMAKVLNLLNYLPISASRINGFIHFSRLLALYEMPHPGFELRPSYQFPVIVTTTLWVIPPLPNIYIGDIYIYIYILTISFSLNSSFLFYGLFW